MAPTVISPDELVRRQLKQARLIRNACVGLALLLFVAGWKSKFVLGVPVYVAAPLAFAPGFIAFLVLRLIDAVRFDAFWTNAGVIYRPQKTRTYRLHFSLSLLLLVGGVLALVLALYNGYTGNWSV